MVKIKVQSLVLKIDKKELKISIEDAQALFNELCSIFDYKLVAPFRTSPFIYDSSNSITLTQDNALNSSVVSDA